MTTATKKLEQEEAKERLRAFVKPGDTLHTVLRHTSPSGMTRWIDVYKLEDGNAQWLSGLIATAGIETYDARRECLKVGGAGMDMGFAIVYNVSHALYPEYRCTGKGCPSNLHVNATRPICETCGGSGHVCEHCGTAAGAVSLEDPDNEEWEHSKEAPEDSGCWSGAVGVRPVRCKDCNGFGYTHGRPPKPHKGRYLHKDGYAISQKWM